MPTAFRNLQGWAFLVTLGRISVPSNVSGLAESSEGFWLIATFQLQPSKPATVDDQQLWPRTRLLMSGHVQNYPLGYQHAIIITVFVALPSATACFGMINTLQQETEENQKLEMKRNWILWQHKTFHNKSLVVCSFVGKVDGCDKLIWGHWNTVSVVLLLKVFWSWFFLQ